MSDSLERTTKSPEPIIWAIIPAAGVGSRMQAALPKQYLKLEGQTILELTLQKILALSQIDGVALVLGKEDDYWDESPLASHPKIHRVEGGKERSDSVLRGLQYCQQLLQGQIKEHHKQAWALVHDAARPCVSLEKMNELIRETLQESMRDFCDGAILAAPVADTVKRVVSDSIIDKTEDRSQLWLAHTPQFFPMLTLQNALLSCNEKKLPVTDEASAVEAVGGTVKVFADRRDNIKITLPEDLAWAAYILKQQGVLT